MIKIDKYKDAQKYSFPNQLKTNPKEKQKKDYSIAYCQAIYSAHLRDRASVDYEWWTRAQILRDYGSGKQDEYYYTQQLLGETTETSNVGRVVNGLSDTGNQHTRKGYKNLNTKIISIAQNIKNVAHGIFENYEEDIFVNAIDPISGEIEQNAKWAAYIEAKFGKEFRESELKAGLRVEERIEDFPHDVSQKELDQYKALGGFKANWAIAMEEVLKFTSEVSDWDRTMKRKFIDDIIDLNMICARAYYDPEDMKWKWEYVDPAYFIMQYSKESDFRDSEYAAYYKLEKISELANKGFTPDELRPAAKRYQEQFGNPAKSEWSKHDTPDGNGSYGWFDYRVPVLHSSWIDTDVEKTLKYTTKYGKETYINLDFDDAPKPLSKRREKAGYQQEVVNTNRRYTYQASWIVDTDLCYDYGKMINQPRKSKRVPMLPFLAFRNITTNDYVQFGSIIEMIIPFLDQLQLAWLRMQDTIAKALDDGYAINLRLLNGLNIGGEKIKDHQAFEMFKKTSVLPYMDVSAPGQAYKGGDVIPIHRIPGGLGTRLQESIETININLNLIERFTGINPVALGAQPSSGETATATKLAMQGTKTVLQPFINGIFDLKKRLSDYTTKAIPIMLRNQPGMEEVYARVIGEQDAAFLKVIDREGIEFGLTTDARPTFEDKERLIGYIQMMMQPDKSGLSKLDVAQGMKLINMIESGSNVKQIQMAADFLIKKEKREQQMLQERNIQIQGQQNMQLKQEETQSKIMDKKMEIEGEMAINNQKHQQEMEKIKFEADMAYLNSLRENIQQEKEYEQQNKVSNATG
jgi:hypothetical protein